MIVEIDDQLLDDDAQPRQLVRGQVPAIGECARSLRCLADRIAALQEKRHAVRIGFARGHQKRYVTLPKRLGGLPCINCPLVLAWSPSSQQLLQSAKSRASSR